MLKNAFYIALFVIISWGSYQISYPSNTTPDLFYDGVFLENIIEHVDELTQGDRAVGEYFHDDARRYLIRQLNSMGLVVSKQKSIAYNPNNRTAAPIQNIIAQLSSNQPDKKTLVLMAHYDAAPFAGTGAADAASGVAVILEVVSAFIKTKQPAVNNLMVLFTDAEELGLLGAHAFIKEQLPHHDIGLIINLEARGSSGPVMMWPETVGGNQAMIDAFIAADVPMPATTSLHYEIYRMLPNNTDMTPFNQVGKINGFNLAFIDDHFNYHTRLDTLNNLSLNTLAHQSIQLQALLNHFMTAEMAHLQVEDSLVYFSLPMLGLMSYPTWLNFVLLGLIFVILFSQIRRARQLHQWRFSQLLTGLAPFAAAGIVAYFWSFLLLYLVRLAYPETKDVLQGFPYQGHMIMVTALTGAAILGSSVLVAFKRQLAQLIAINVLSLILIGLLALFLPGSGLLLIPVFFSALLLLIQINKPKWTEQMAPLLAVGTAILMGTLIVNLPIALGVNALPVVSVMVVWLLVLYLPTFSVVKQPWHVLAALLLPVLFMVYHFYQNPSISNTQPLPTSLSYLYDQDSKQAYFFHYDHVSTEWHQDLFTASREITDSSGFRKKYHKPLRQLAHAAVDLPIKGIEITAKQSLLKPKNEEIVITFNANSNSKMLELYTNEPITIHSMNIDNRRMVSNESLSFSAGQRVLRYYFDGKKSIELTITLSADDVLDWQVQTHALNLLGNPELGIGQRPANQTPKPFIQSDNTVVVQSFTFGSD